MHAYSSESLRLRFGRLGVGSAGSLASSLLAARAMSNCSSSYAASRLFIVDRRFAAAAAADRELLDSRPPSAPSSLSPSLLSLLLARRCGVRSRILLNEPVRERRRLRAR